MTLEGMEKAIWGAAAAVMTVLATILGMLVTWVRGGDLARIEAIEQKHRDLEKAGSDGREKIYAELHSLRSKVDANHTQLVTLLLENRKL